MNKQQQDFLEHLAMRIPRLFEAIAQGNVKSEYIIGVRSIGARHVRLKLVAEVADPGANPLATHGQMSADAQSSLRAVDMSALDDGGAGAVNPVSVNEMQSAASDSTAAASDCDAEPCSDPSDPAAPGPASRRRRSRKR